MVTVLFLASFVALAAILISAYVLTRRDRTRAIAPARELQRKHGLYAERRPTIHLDAERVPQHLRHLIPLAETWGIGDDIIRNDFIAKASDSDKRALHDAFYGPYEQVTSWLDSLRGQAMTKEAEAFMYAQLALDEMGYYILEEKQRARK
jgi:hypothetical protein